MRKGQRMDSEELRRQKFVRMTEGSVKGLICRMSIPTIISMLVTALYNMADTFFVGRISTSATAGVGVVFSVMSIIQAVGFCFGQGSGNYISRKLGERNLEESSRMAATGFISAFGAGLVIMVFGLLFSERFALMLGSTETILPHARQYMCVILIGAPFMTSSLVLNNQLRLQGNAMYAMIGIAAGAVINIALDPIFIFTFGMGVGGAALATVVSQFLSFCLLLAGCRRGGNIAIRLRDFSPNIRRYWEIARGGAPSLFRQGLASAAVIALNLAARVYGDAAVAAMSIVTRVTMFAFAALIGLGQGFQPVCGFNYGAKRYDRVLEAFWFCLKLGTFSLAVLAALGFVFAPEVIALFRKEDAEVVAIGARALRAQCLALPLLAWFTLNNMTMQNIGAFGRASLLATARQGLFFLPLIMILPRFFGLWGIIICQPLADLCSFLLALPLGIGVIRELGAGECRKREGPSETALNPPS